jgi:hypothetical protein
MDACSPGQPFCLTDINSQNQETAFHHIGLETERRSPGVTGAERSEAERTDRLRRGQKTANDAYMKRYVSHSGKSGMRQRLLLLMLPGVHL